MVCRQSRYRGSSNPEVVSARGVLCRKCAAIRCRISAVYLPLGVTMVSAAFDPTDPYDAAAMYNGFLLCEGCGVEPIAEPPAKYNLGHYHDVGQAAKSQGWFVAPLKGPDVSFQVFCAACANGRDLAPTPSRRYAPSEALLTVADLASGPSTDVTPNKSLERTRDS